MYWGSLAKALGNHRRGAGNVSVCDRGQTLGNPERCGLAGKVDRLPENHDQHPQVPRALSGRDCHSGGSTCSPEQVRSRLQLVTWVSREMLTSGPRSALGFSSLAVSQCRWWISSNVRIGHLPKSPSWNTWCLESVLEQSLGRTLSPCVPNFQSNLNPLKEKKLCKETS